MKEIELKFQVPGSEQESVSRVLRQMQAGTCLMRALYYDSPLRHLAQVGVALRLRQEGDQWVQTLKARGDGLVDRLEHNARRIDPTGDAAAIVAPGLDLSLHDGHPAGRVLKRQLAQAGLSAGDLRVQYETAFERLSMRQSPDGDLDVEVALDQGEIRCETEGLRRTLPLCELEFECLGGSVAAWLEWLKPWVMSHGLWLDLRSKAERGDRLARGLGAPLRPVASDAGLKDALEGVLRLAAEIIEGQADRRHALALADGLGVLERVLLNEGQQDAAGQVRRLGQHLAAAPEPSGQAGELQASALQCLWIDLLALTLAD